MIADVYPTERLGVVMGSVLSANTLGLLLGDLILPFRLDFLLLLRQDLLLEAHCTSMLGAERRSTLALLWL
jgi:hypothetical protein